MGPRSPCDDCPGFFGKQNPFWEWSSKFCAMMALLVLILFLRADNFDSTEIWVIGLFATGVGLGKGIDIVAGDKIRSAGGVVKWAISLFRKK